MQIRQLTDDTEKQRVTRRILEALPDWFGIPEAREEYIAESAGKSFFCAYDGDSPAGFLYLKERDATRSSYTSWAFCRSSTGAASGGNC